MLLLSTLLSIPVIVCAVVVEGMVVSVEKDKGMIVETQTQCNSNSLTFNGLSSTFRWSNSVIYRNKVICNTSSNTHTINKQLPSNQHKISAVTGPVLFLLMEQLKERLSSDR